MHPNVLWRASVIALDGDPIPASSIRGLPDYEEASQGGRFYVAAVAMRHRVKYLWATRRPGCAQAEVYRQCEFMALDELPACCPTFVLHRRELLGDVVGCRYDDTEVRTKVCDVVREFAREALRKGWESTLVEVEVETTTVLSYDWVQWWCPVPCALPRSAPGGKGHPIEELEMEVYAEEEGADAEGCAICLEDFTAGTEVERLPCRHRFHGECVLRWLEGEGSCPLCRSEFRIK